MDSMYARGISPAVALTPFFMVPYILPHSFPLFNLDSDWDWMLAAWPHSLLCNTDPFEHTIQEENTNILIFGLSWGALFVV